jgi:hypothetical protein
MRCDSRDARALPAFVKTCYVNVGWVLTSRFELACSRHRSTADYTVTADATLYAARVTQRPSAAFLRPGREGEATKRPSESLLFQKPTYSGQLEGPDPHAT